MGLSAPEERVRLCLGQKGLGVEGWAGGQETWRMCGGVLPEMMHVQEGFGA